MNNKSKGIGGINLIACLLLLAAMYWFMGQTGGQKNDFSYYDFEAALKAGEVSEVVIEPNKVVPTGTLVIKLENEEAEKLYVSDVKEIEELLQSYKVDYELEDVPQESVFVTAILPTLLMIGAAFILFTMMGKQGGGMNAKAMNFGKSRAKMSTEADNKVTFENVAGLHEEKEDLEEIVDFLREPGKYTRVGARIPKGVLLEGPPGTGKTLLAKAVAGEAKVPFFSISGSDFVEMFVGVGASRVRDLFQEAKENAPCIIFIDEIDAVARRRGTGMGGGHDERTDTQPVACRDGWVWCK